MTTTPYTPEVFSPKAMDLFDKACDDLVVKGLTTIMKMKLPPTLEHCMGVGRIMAGIATETNLKDVVGDPVEYVRDGILHDVGKIRVDNHILDYPGRLDDTKMNEIKSHPVDGFELVHTFHSVFKGKPSENLAVRILLSHYAQPNMYPGRLEIAEKLAAYNIDPSLPEDTDYMMGSLGLDIADHFEARFPNSKKVVVRTVMANGNIVLEYCQS